MFSNVFKNKLDKYIFENINFRLVTTVLVLLIAYLTWIIVSRTDSQKIVFMPPKIISQEFWITGNEVSKSYLHEMAQFVIFNLLNITKHNASSNVDNIMPLIDPAYYNQVKTELVAQNEYVIANSISRTFFLSAIDADSKGTIIVQGVMKDIIGDKVVNSNPYLINIGYKIEQGRFWINAIEVKENK